MAEPIKVPDENSPFEEKIAYLRSQNIPEDTIAKHFSQVNDPNAQAWVRQYKIGQAQTAANQAMGPTSNASSPAPGSLDTSGIQSLNKVANKFTNWYANLSTPEQIAYPIGTILGTYAGGKAINYAYDTLKDKRQADIEVKKQAALNALPPSAAVQVQQQQLALQQAEQANRFAQQAAGVNAGPVYDPLLDARVQTETQRTASEAARTKIAEAQAQLAQEKLIQTQRKAAMVKANPAGAAAQVAAAEGLPVDAQITTGAQPSAAQLAETHGINLPTAQGSVTPPTNVEPVPVSPANATPAVPETPTTTAEVVANPNATPVEKVVTLTQEAPVVPPSVEQKVAELNSRISSSPVAPPETSIETRRTPAQMEVFKSENPLNKGYNQVAAAAGITPNTPHEEANKFMNRVTDEVFGGKPPASQGGAAPQAKQITNFIESNANEFPNIYQKLKEIQAKYPTQSGFAHLQMLANLGFNVLGGLGLYHDYKEGKKTGDWSNLGLDSIGQVLGNVLPKASGLGANLMLHHEEAGHGSAFYGPGSQFPSAHTYEQYLQASKIGAGRGMQGVPPPTR